MRPATYLIPLSLAALLLALAVLAVLIVHYRSTRHDDPTDHAHAAWITSLRPDPGPGRGPDQCNGHPSADTAHRSEHRGDPR